MATNIDQLKNALSEYHEGVEQHVTALQEQFEDLQPLWQSLKQEYGGTEADELIQSWEQTAAWFEDYIQSSQRINAFLADRLSHLNNL